MDEKSKPIGPSKRFGHTMHLFKNQLIVFGGGGNYIEKIKKRESFNDTHYFNIGRSNNNILRN
jgi:hypothetical protein